MVSSSVGITIKNTLLLFKYIKSIWLEFYLYVLTMQVHFVQSISFCLTIVCLANLYSTKIRKQNYCHSIFAYILGVGNIRYCSVPWPRTSRAFRTAGKWALYGGTSRRTGKHPGWYISYPLGCCIHLSSHFSRSLVLVIVVVYHLYCKYGFVLLLFLGSNINKQYYNMTEIR